ncbi:hypothetical protein A3F29_04515 [Candidatus Roizmanbacteria bacterium RIFCSPHIGHO2_12_FULL_33_9]|uniref:Uncharacterized protein n=1 Tax=Candidatus Roizmanbacteria bacterium RIFCSPHIGHO2_12_FULL_33_9 TaxID=1802045 RepID=A0A1F7HJ53_9BACT|nr:MAG: hypothetical protein A3F29_04515 [Candidatus Roizmanbacteria bacterium RIFCSPHIGHO2_12_FULL_33_9]
MKIQDIVFILVLLFLIYKRDSKWATLAGLSSLVLAIPLFATWIFFTAERLTWYAATFFLLSIIFLLLKSKTSK